MARPKGGINKSIEKKVKDYFAKKKKNGGNTQSGSKESK